VCLEGVLRKRDSSEVTDDEINEKTTTLYSFFLGRLVSARNEYQKKVQKIERKEFPSYAS
jgi:flagellin-specific chaperone FliS